MPTRCQRPTGKSKRRNCISKAERDERDDRILDYRLRHGLSETEIANLEGIHKSSVSRSLRRTYDRWRGNPIDIGATLRGSLHRLQAISDHGMHEAFLESDRRTKVLCLRTAALAEGFTHRLLMMLGMINPDVLPTGHDPERADAAEIRRLADEVGRMGVLALPPAPDDLVSEGEREWLDGNIVEADHAPTADTPPSAPAPLFQRAPRVSRAPATETQRPLAEPPAGMVGGTERRSRDPRRDAMARVAPPGER